MAPGPIMKFRLSAKSDATMTSSSSTGAYGNQPDSKGRKTRAARTPKMNTRNGAELGLNGASIGAELRLAASGFPNRPHGMNTRTTAKKMNSTTSVSLGNAKLKPEKTNEPRATHNALTSTQTHAATKAPR